MSIRFTVDSIAPYQDAQTPKVSIGISAYDDDLLLLRRQIVIPVEILQSEFPDMSNISEKLSDFVVGAGAAFLPDFGNDSLLEISANLKATNAAYDQSQEFCDALNAALASQAGSVTIGSGATVEIPAPPPPDDSEVIQ